MSPPQVAPQVTPEAEQLDMMAQYNQHLKEQADAYDTVQGGAPWISPDPMQLQAYDDLEDNAMTQLLAQQAAGGQAPA